MIENLSVALQITVVGMSFVLAVLAWLWLIMAVLVRLTAEPVTTEAAPAATMPAARVVRQRAAAVAVAIALARQARSVAVAPRPLLSPWQAVRRAQLLNQRERRR